MFEHIWTDKKRNTEIKKEKKRLDQIFKDLDEDKRNTVSGLIQSAAFQAVMLTELSMIIKRDGYVEEYQNGANQKGYKKSAAVESYDKSLNTYSKIIKQLTDLLPENHDANVPGAAIMNFVNKGKT